MYEFQGVFGEMDTPELKAKRDQMLTALSGAWAMMPDLSFGQLLATASPVFLKDGPLVAEDQKLLVSWTEFAQSCHLINSKMNANPLEAQEVESGSEA